MKYLVYLITLLFSTAVAQNPTILQGNYVSNVFGQANFVLNPNAQTSAANVTVSNATATRSTTTPLVATTEWNVTVTSANGTATWATRSFDEGMKNQNCEARFSYRGFQATSKAQIKQGANVVAELTLTPSATDPRIASINFPCGDLSAATTFVITDSATLSGTNEIGGIYVGLATNMANVAQAEFVGKLRNRGSSSCSWLGNGTSTPIAVDNDCSTYEKTGLDLQPATRIPAIEFTTQKAGYYLINVSGYFATDSSTDTACEVNENGTSVSSLARTYLNTLTNTESRQTIAIHRELSANTFYRYDIRCQTVDRILARNNYSSEWLEWIVHRFPSSSELVVTPETQNVWGASTYAGTTFGPTYFSGTAAPTSYTTISDAGYTSRRTLKGKCKAPIIGDDVGCQIENMPVGNYKVSLSGLMYEKNLVVGGRTVCNYEIYETTLSNTIASRTSAEMRTVSNDQIYRSTSMDGVFTNSSVANRNFVIRTKKGADINTGNVGACSLFIGEAAATDHTTVDFIIEPLDNNSNSALYVQGPVKAAATGTAIPAGYLGSSEFGGGTGSQSLSGGSGNVTLYTINNVTPGVYFVRSYASAQRLNPFTATYFAYSCRVTTNSSDTGNWYDYLNIPQSRFGDSGPNYTGPGSITNHLASSHISQIQVLNIPSTASHYVRCTYDTNNSGFILIGGAEFIRLN